MSKKFYVIGLVIVLAVLSYLAFDSYSKKTEMLASLDKLVYTSGTLEFYKTRSNPTDETNTIRKFLQIKLKERDVLFTDGKFLLAGLDKERFVEYVEREPELTLGFVDMDDPNRKRLYDIQVQGKSLVDFDQIRWRLQVERFAGILLGLAFGVYGLNLLRRPLRTAFNK